MSPIKADRWMVGRAELFSWRFEQNNKGWDNFSLARSSWTISLIVLALPGLWFGFAGIVISLILNAFVWIIGLTIIGNVEIDVRIKAGIRGVNPFRDKSMVHIACVAFGLYLLFPLEASWMTDAVSLLLRIATLYLVSCNLSPPGWRHPDDGALKAKLAFKRI